jgi:low temperature requirement protein LtrA
MFLIVWLAWFNGSAYHELHGQNDIRTRVFTFLQMFTVVAMAVFAHNALGEGAVGFALSFAAFQLILTYLWWRTGVHDPEHRPLSQPYCFAYLASAFLFVSSVFIPAPWRFVMWGLALLLSLVTPVYVLTLGKKDPLIQAEIDHVTAVRPSFVERFGLFTIIVLGEVIVGVVQGVAGHHHLSWLVGGTAALGMLIAIGLWWIYFDFISHRMPKPGHLTVSWWMNLHLPLTIGIATIGAVILNMVEHAGEQLLVEIRWLLVAAVAIVLISIAFLINTVQLTKAYQPVYRRGSRIMAISAIMIFLLGFSNLSGLKLLILLCLFMLTPVFYGIKAWIKMLGKQ